MFWPSRIHWQVPTILAATTLGGILCAFAHHLFYNNLDGDSVPEGSYALAGRNLSKQQLNIFVGTALAYLVKTCLCFAISTAYVQVFWHRLRAQKHSPTLSELDWASSTLDDVFQLFNVRLGWKHLPFVLPAVVFWCIPVATIFTPATLSVTTLRGAPNALLEVPQLDFTTLKYSSDLRYVSSAGVLNTWQFAGPSQPLQHLASAVLGQGQILSISPPAANSSWTLDFWGPSLQCADVTGAQREKTWRNLWNAFNLSSVTLPPRYLAWVPWSYNDYNLFYDNLETHGIDSSLPYLLRVARGPDIMGPPPSQVSTEGPLSFFIAALPSSRNIAITKNLNRTMIYRSSTIESCFWESRQDLNEPLMDCEARSTPFVPMRLFDSSTLLRCDLFNSSITANFTYTKGEQNVHVTSRLSVPVNGSNWFSVKQVAPHPSGHPDGSERPNCTPFQRDPRRINNGTACEFDIAAVRSLSYQSILAAFNSMIIGAVYDPLVPDGFNSSVLKTILSDTDELAFIRDWKPFAVDGDFPSLQTQLLNSTQTAYQSLLSESRSSSSRGALIQNLERAFENFTLSMLSQPAFRANYSSVFAPPAQTKVALDEFSVAYRYDALTLWLAYGVAIGFTMVTVVHGFIAIFQNDASFTKDFSTVVRVARTAQLNVEVAEKDGVGNDPLPQYLKDAQLDIRSIRDEFDDRRN